MFVVRVVKAAGQRGAPRVDPRVLAIVPATSTCQRGEVLRASLEGVRLLGAARQGLCDECGMMDWNGTAEYHKLMETKTLQLIATRLPLPR